jgi:hypothetical protein
MRQTAHISHAYTGVLDNAAILTGRTTRSVKMLKVNLNIGPLLGTVSPSKFPKNEITGFLSRISNPASMYSVDMGVVARRRTRPAAP